MGFPHRVSDTVNAMKHFHCFCFLDSGKNLPKRLDCDSGANFSEGLTGPTTMGLAQG